MVINYCESIAAPHRRFRGSPRAYWRDMCYYKNCACAFCCCTVVVYLLFRLKYVLKLELFAFIFLFYLNYAKLTISNIGTNKARGRRILRAFWSIAAWPSGGGKRMISRCGICIFLRHYDKKQETKHIKDHL